MIKLIAAIVSVVLLAYGVWKLMRSKAHRERRELLRSADRQSARLDAEVEIEIEKAEEQPEIDAEQDRADSLEAAAVAQAAQSGDLDLERLAGGVAGGQMPKSSFDEDLGL